MQKEVKFKGLSGLMIECSFVSRNSGNFYLNEENKISTPKLGSSLSNSVKISDIKQKEFVLLLMKRRTFSGTPGKFSNHL